MIDRIQTSMLPTIQVVHSSNEPSQTSLLKCFNPIKNSELLVSHHRSKNRSINSKRAAHELHVFQQIPELFLAPRANHHPPNYLHSTPRSISKKKKSILKLFITLSNLGSPDKRASSITWFDKDFFGWRCQPVVCFFLPVAHPLATWMIRWLQSK